ncbi:hypothetical protein RCL1_008186 [Eukaryota sp. TZLM3-RCL]
MGYLASRPFDRRVYRLTKAGLNVSKALLLEMALGQLDQSDHLFLNSTFIDLNDKSGVPLREKITFDTGFLGKLKKLFEENEIEDDQMENFDETLLILNADTGRNLAHRGSHHIKYLDVVSGTIGFTMVIRLTGGRTGRIAPTMIIFKGSTEGAQIRGLQDDVINISTPLQKAHS